MPDHRWRWDDTLYAGSARYYRTGRLPYPDAVAEALRRELDPAGRGRLLDVGCGPGSLTIPLAPLFAEVVGVDADREMIAQAGLAAQAAGVGNVSWHRLRAEQLPAGLGRFRVVTFAQSFHWLDRPRVAALVRAMLEPDGYCVHVQASTQHGVPGEDPLRHPRPPRSAIGALVTSYLGPTRRAGQSYLPDGTPSGEDSLFRAAGFRGPVRIPAGGGEVVDRTEDEIVASVFSLSSAAPHLFGQRLSDFEDELRELLRRTSPGGWFAEQTGPVALDLWRP